MPTIAELIIGLRGDTKDFDRKVKATKARLKSLGQSMKVAAAAAAAVTAAIGIKSVKAFASFDKALNQSAAIMKGAVANMGAMEQAARDVAKTTTFSASQAADAFFFLASAGLNAKQSIASLPQVAAFATAGQFDLARATDLVTDAQSALGLSVKNAQQNLRNMTRVTDVLVKANTLANASVEQFSEALTTKAATAARNAGVEFEELVAVLAVFADQGIKGALAGTQFAIVLRDLQTKAIQNEKAFKSFNISVFDSNDELNSLADIIGDIETALDGMSTKTQKQTLLTLGFTDKSVSALQAVIGLSKQVRGFTKDLRDAGGTTKQIADKQLTSLANKFAILKNKVNDVFLEIGKRLAPVLEKLIPIIESVIDGTRKMILGFEDLTRSTDRVAIAERLFDVTREIRTLSDQIGEALDKPGPRFELLGVLERQIRSAKKEAAALTRQLELLSSKKPTTTDVPKLPEVTGAGGAVGAPAAVPALSDIFAPEVVGSIKSAQVEIAKIIELQTRFNEVVEQTNEFANDLWFNWAVSAGEAFAQIKIGAFELFQGFVSGFGDAVAQAIVFGEDFSEVMKSLFKNVLASLVSTIIQFLIELVIAKIVAAGITAGFHIARVAQELQVVYLAAFASTAAIPIIGPGLAPGVAAAAVATAAAGSLAAAGSAPAVAAGAVGGLAEGGLTTRTGLALLHPNELITPIEKVPGIFGNDKTQEVNILMDGRLLARKVIRGMPREVNMVVGTI